MNDIMHYRYSIILLPITTGPIAPVRHIWGELARVRRCSSEWLWCDNFEQVNSPRTTWLFNSTDALVSCWGLDPPLIHVSAGPTTCLFAGPTSSQLEETSARARPPAAAHSSPFPNLSLLRRPSANVYLLRHALKMATVWTSAAHKVPWLPTPRPS